MSFTHTNTIRYLYGAGGSTTSDVVTRSESAGAEFNVSESINAVITENAIQPLPLGVLEVPSGQSFVSSYLRVDGASGVLYGSGTIGGSAGSAQVMATLQDGKPMVWSSNGGSNFPPGATNPFIVNGAFDSGLVFIPTSGSVASGQALTITVKSLYDPTA